MEKFNWTPQQIDEIPLGRLQRIFIVMEQRDVSARLGEEARMQKEAATKGKK